MTLLDITLTNGWAIAVGLLIVIILFNLFSTISDLKKQKDIYFKKATETENQLKIDKNENQSKLKEQTLTFQKQEAELKVTYQNWAIAEFDKFKKLETEKIQKEAENQAFKAATVLLQKWKIENEAKIRQDAINRSYSVNLGKITEHLVPFHQVFLSQFNPKDARFIGSPIDLIVFDGNSDKKDDIIIYFVEIKTGTSKLTETQKRIKRCVENGEVRWAEINPDSIKTIDISTNNLEFTNNQLDLFNLNIEQRVQEALNEIGVSENIYINTLNKIKNIINQGFTKAEAIEKIVGGVKFKNANHQQILFDTFMKALN